MRRLDAALGSEDVRKTRGKTWENIGNHGTPHPNVGKTMEKTKNI